MAEFLKAVLRVGEYYTVVSKRPSSGLEMQTVTQVFQLLSFSAPSRKLVKETSQTHEDLQMSRCPATVQILEIWTGGLPNADRELEVFALQSPCIADIAVWANYSDIREHMKVWQPQVGAEIATPSPRTRNAHV
jgi:hypothetical protein